jgi:hypothetical protein
MKQSCHAADKDLRDVDETDSTVRQMRCRKGLKSSKLWIALRGVEQSETTRTEEETQSLHPGNPKPSGDRRERIRALESLHQLREGTVRDLRDSQTALPHCRSQVLWIGWVRIILQEVRRGIGDGNEIS